ncbi:MAG: pitrilysin family protein [Bryobacteraceae bacterium]|jgi:zinc protease
MRFATGILLLYATLAAGQQLDVKTHTLDNGMRLLIHEDHNIPNVALYFFFKIGSRNERPGATGVSHFFEHMMFNGAKKYGPKQFDTVMEKSGGRNNAYTTRDDTVYTDWFPRAMLEQMLDMEADRIRDLSFDPKMIESERGVVYSERRNSEDSSFGALDEQLNAAAFMAHPYHWPVLGWASDIESWTMDDLKSHFRMGYAPNNCVMVAVGDVKAEEVIALAKKYLEPIPRHDPPPPVRTVEPEQKGERRVVLNKAAQLPLQMFSYHVPRSESPEHYALEALSNVLAEGRSSRLYRRLVDRDQLAINVGCGAEFSLDPGQMIFTIQPRSGVDPAKSEQAFLEEIERVRSAGVSPDELQKAKNQLLADFYRELKRISGKANLLGEYEVFLGDYRKLLTADKELEKVTAEDVQNVAKRYLGPKNKTVATLIPEKPEAAK